MPNQGRTIIEKLEDAAATASFAVALLTADDLGRLSTEGSGERPRARQNVIFEAGYFVARLGRSNVVLLHEDGVELPSDLSGVVYESLDASGNWRGQLGKEMRAAGIKADSNQLR